ncbi:MULTISPECIES: hypothetical protein [unclassified Carboxylicivirga]|uniref:hypothetical protein n=1 Tax=Carboxylicivirga TaxID=1628153 RepID=UPI003D3344FC
MDKKKILLVSNAFHPEVSPRSFRATELAKELCRQGYEVTVISKFRDFDYTDFLKMYPFSLKMWSKPYFSGGGTLKIKPLAYGLKIFLRVIAVLFEYPAIIEMFKVKEMLRTEQGYDMMISFAVPFPVHWGVAWARRKKHTIAHTWVADCGDAYMFARLDTFRKPFYFKYLEKGFCRRCDYISIPFSQLGDQFYPEFKSKMRVIPQGFNFSDIHLSGQAVNNHRPSFIFAGSVIPGIRDLDKLLEFLVSSNLDFLFIVYTNQPDYYLKYKSKLGDKLLIKEYIDRISLIYEMSKVNFLVNIDTIHDSKNNVEAIPSKLIDYALSGRPILNINSAHLDTELVKEFFDHNYSKQRIIDKSKFDIKIVVSKFISLIK